MTGSATTTPAGSGPAAIRTLSNYVGGAWTPPLATATQESRNPADGDLLAHVPLSGAADVDAAVRAAREAFPAWRGTSPIKRARAVFALRDLLDAHRDELARIVTTDMGKTLADAAGEVGRGIESTEAACAAPHMLKGDNLEGVATGLDVEMVRQPVGVIGAITPFNFPAMIPLWFRPYAVACGNTFVLKPSENDPLTSARIFELIDSAAIFPPGVVNLVHGGRDAVGALLDHPQVDGISFVGSAATARIVYSRAAATGKRVQALGGAKNAMVLMPDADPELTLHGVLGSAFGAAGQRCLAGSLAVLVGTEAEQDRMRDLLLEGAGRAACYVEVKNVTAAASGGVALFPDCVSARGTKHLRELLRLKRQGLRPVQVYCVQRGDVAEVRPADGIDHEYGRMLRAAIAGGVEVLAYRARVSAREIRLAERIPVVCP